LFGNHTIPPGDIGIVGIVSVSKSEAKKRLRTVKQILDVLGERYKPLSEGDGVELLSRPIAFQVMAATLSGVVGGTWICGICDEVAHWRDKDTGVNPANEVLASMRPTMATMPSAQMFLSSSALGTEDAHAKSFDEGETSRQSTAAAESWIANPTLTEAGTKADEPSHRVWLREYANRPQAAVSSVFDGERISRAFVGTGDLAIGAAAEQVMVIDASRGGDAFAWGRFRWVWVDGKARFQLVENGETPPVDLSEDFTERSIAFVVALCKAHNITSVCADQYEAGSLGLHFKQAGLTFWEHTWSLGSKRTAVDHIERWMRSNDLLLCESPKLKLQLQQYRERITKNGDLTYSGSGPHDDYVQVLMTAAMANDANRFAMVSKPVQPVNPNSDEFHRERERRWEEQARSTLREQMTAEDLYNDD